MEGPGRLALSTTAYIVAKRQYSTFINTNWQIVYKISFYLIKYECVSVATQLFSLMSKRLFLPNLNVTEIDN